MNYASINDFSLQNQLISSLLQQKSTELRSISQKTMQYQDFIQKSFSLIRQHRSTSSQHFSFSNIANYAIPKKLQPSNIFLQIYIHTNQVRIKLEQWSFITHRTLLKSVNCEDQDSDPQLDNVQIQTQNFFQIIQKLLGNVCPKVLIKQLKPHSIEFLTVVNESKLAPFEGDSTFVIKVGGYQSNNFDCNISMKYNYQYEGDQYQQQLGSQGRDSCQFQLLIDPAFEQKKKQYQQQYVQARKLSQGDIYQRQFSPQPLKKKNSRIQTEKQKKQLAKMIEDPDLIRIKKLFEEIDFKSVKSSTLGDFLAYNK